MKTFRNQAAQGDLFILRVSELPENVLPKKGEEGKIVVAHSETGHHHYFKDKGNVDYFAVPDDPFTCYLRVTGGGAELIHNRTFDTHETIKVPEGVFLLRRQREATPEGWRRVED